MCSHHAVLLFQVILFIWSCIFFGTFFVIVIRRNNPMMCMEDAGASYCQRWVAFFLFPYFCLLKLSQVEIIQIVLWQPSGEDAGFLLRGGWSGLVGRTLEEVTVSSWEAAWCTRTCRQGDCSIVREDGVRMLTQVCHWYVHCVKASSRDGAMGTECTHGWAARGDWGWHVGWAVLGYRVAKKTGSGRLPRPGLTHGGTLCLGGTCGAVDLTGLACQCPDFMKLYNALWGVSHQTTWYRISLKNLNNAQWI